MNLELKNVLEFLESVAVPVSDGAEGISSTYVNEGIYKCNSHMGELSNLMNKIAYEKLQSNRKLKLMKSKMTLLRDADTKVAKKNADKIVELEQNFSVETEYLENLKFMEEACQNKMQLLKHNLSSIRFQWSVVEAEMSITPGATIPHSDQKKEVAPLPSKMSSTTEQELLELEQPATKPTVEPEKKPEPKADTAAVDTVEDILQSLGKDKSLTTKSKKQDDDPEALLLGMLE